MTRVSKKFFSFFRSSTSDIQGKGLVAPGYCSGSPIWAQRRLAMKLKVLLEHGCVQAQHAAGHGVVGVLALQVDGVADHLHQFLLEVLGPQVRVLDLDLVDHVDAEVHVHGLVAQDVLELLGGAGHLVAPAHAQDLDEADVEEDALEDDVEGDQLTQELAVVLRGAGVEVGVGQVLGVGQGPLRLLGDRRHLPVHVEDLALVQP